MGVPLLSLVSCFGIGLLLAVGVGLVRYAWSIQQRGITESQSEAGRSSGAPNAEFLRFYRQAEKNFAAERYAEAFEEYTRASQLDRTDPRPPLGLGRVYQALFFNERAEQAYREAIRLDPEYTPAKEKLAFLLHDFGKYREAIALWREIQEKSPEYPLVWAELALNELRLGNPEKAIGLLERYNAAPGDKAWGYAILGRAHAEAGNDAAAEKACREALNIDPYRVDAYFWLGQLLISTGRKAEAEPLLERYRELRNLETKEHSLKMRLVREPDDVGTLVRVAEVRCALGKTRLALSTLQRALDAAPDHKRPRLRQLYEHVARSLAEKEKARTGDQSGPPSR